MNNAFFVHMLQTVTDLLDDRCGFLLWQFSFLLHLLQTSIGEGFDDQVEVFFVVEVAKECSNVGLVQVGLYLYFPENMIFHLHLSDSLLRHLLDHTDEADVLLLGHVDVPEGSLAQLVQDLEVAQFYLPLWPCVSSFFGGQGLLRLHLILSLGLCGHYFYWHFKGLLLLEFETGGNGGVKSRGLLVIFVVAVVLATILGALDIVDGLLCAGRQKFGLFEVVQSELLQILHALDSLDGGPDHRPGGLRPSEVLPLLQKLEVLLFQCLQSSGMQIMFIIALRLLNPNLILRTLPQKGHHLAINLRPAGESQVDGLSSFFGGFRGFRGHVPRLVQLAKTVEGFIGSRAGANHALTDIIIMCEWTVLFLYGLLSVILLECCGYFPRHTVQFTEGSTLA